MGVGKRNPASPKPDRNPAALKAIQLILTQLPKRNPAAPDLGTYLPNYPNLTPQP